VNFCSDNSNSNFGLVYQYIGSDQQQNVIGNKVKGFCEAFPARREKTQMFITKHTICFLWTLPNSVQWIFLELSQQQQKQQLFGTK